MGRPLAAETERRTGGPWLGWLRQVNLSELALLSAWVVGMPALWIAIYHAHQSISTDIWEYHRYALAFWTGHPRFHALPHEYPPLAIVLFSLTLLPSLANYQAVFIIWMGLLGVPAYLAFRHFASRRQAMMFVAYLLLGAVGTLVTRFDIVPGVLTAGALWAAQRRRFGTAYVLLALGVLVKLYPIFLVPVVAIEHWRTLVPAASAGDGGMEGQPAAAKMSGMAWRTWLGVPIARVALGVGICAGLVLTGFLAALALNPEGTLSIFLYAGNRPLEVESTPATLLWLGTYAGFPARYAFSFGSYNYVGALDAVLKPLSTVAVAAGCLWVYWRHARGHLTIGRAFLAALCVVLATNKIFSPQYLIWVLPFVSMELGWDLVWMVICLLTTLDYPIIYRLMPTWAQSVTWQFMLVLAARNALALYATIRALAPATRTTGPASSAPAPAEVAPALVSEHNLG